MIWLIIPIAIVAFITGTIIGFNRGVNEADPAGWGSA